MSQSIRVKFFQLDTSIRLEQAVNAFLKSDEINKVVKIKYKSKMLGTDMQISPWIWTAMVTYR